MQDTLAGRGQVNYNDLSDTEVADLKALVSSFLEGSASVDLLPCQTLKQVKETYRQMQVVYTASKSSQVILYSTVQYITVQYSTVQVLYSTSIVQSHVCVMDDNGTDIIAMSG